MFESFLNKGIQTAQDDWPGKTVDKTTWCWVCIHHMKCMMFCNGYAMMTALHALLLLLPLLADSENWKVKARNETIQHRTRYGGQDNYASLVIGNALHWILNEKRSRCNPRITWRRDMVRIQCKLCHSNVQRSVEEMVCQMCQCEAMRCWPWVCVVRWISWDTRQFLVCASPTPRAHVATNSHTYVHTHAHTPTYHHCQLSTSSITDSMYKRSVNVCLHHWTFSFVLDMMKNNIHSIWAFYTVWHWSNQWLSISVGATNCKNARPSVTQK